MGKKKNSLQAHSHNNKKYISITHEEEELPSPEILSRYRSIDTRFADFVIEYTKYEQRYRHTITSERDKRVYKIAHGSFYLHMMGLISAFVLVLVFVVLSACLFYLKRPWVGTGTIVLSFISFLSTLIRRRDNNKGT